MAKTKVNINLVAALLVVLSVTFIPVVFALLDESDISAEPGIFVYKANGTWPMNHWANPDCTNITICTDEGTATIRVRVTMPSRVYVPANFGDILNAGGYLKTVSYKASWENNKTINLFNGRTGSELNYNLSGIPYGHQQITVTASCDVLLFDDGFSSTYPVSQSAEHQVNFTVAPASMPTPTLISNPTPVSPVITLEQTTILAAIIIIIIGLALYRKNVKNDMESHLKVHQNHKSLVIARYTMRS